MNNKRRFVVVSFISLVVLSLVLTIYLVNHKQDRNFKFVFEMSKLSDHISNYVPDYTTDKYGIDIFKSNNNIVYGTILNYTSADSILFETIALFTYNTESDEFNYYKINENVRIVDFLISNDKIYMVKLFHGEDGYDWKIEESNLLLNDNREIDNGQIQNLFNYPRLRYLNSKDFIIATINDDSDTMKEDYKIISFIDGEFNTLNEDTGSLNEDVGNLLYNIDNIDVSNDDKIYYTIVDEKHCQFLRSYDIKSSSEEIVYNNCDESKIIYNHKWTPKGIYIQVVQNQENRQAEIIVLQKKNNEYSITFQLTSNMNTFDKVLDDKNILFHNESNKWKVLMLDEHKLVDVKEVELNLYPKYVNLSNGKIFVQDYSEKFYIGTLHQ